MESGFFEALAFYMLAATILGSAIMVIMMRNIVHSVMFLAITFIAMAGLFLVLNADFLAMVQLLVYAGAVCIMVVFGIMLIRRKEMSCTNLFNAQTKVAGAVAALVIGLCGFLSATTHWAVTATAVPERTIEHIGELLMSKYVIPFEVVALLLLVALIGAIMVAKEVKADADN